MACIGGVFELASSPRVVTIRGGCSDQKCAAACESGSSHLDMLGLDNDVLIEVLFRKPLRLSQYESCSMLGKHNRRRICLRVRSGLAASESAETREDVTGMWISKGGRKLHTV